MPPPSAIATPRTSRGRRFPLCEKGVTRGMSGSDGRIFSLFSRATPRPDGLWREIREDGDRVCGEEPCRVKEIGNTPVVSHTTGANAHRRLVTAKHLVELEEHESMPSLSLCEKTTRTPASRVIPKTNPHNPIHISCTSTLRIARRNGPNSTSPFQGPCPC